LLALAVASVGLRAVSWEFALAMVQERSRTSRPSIVRKGRHDHASRVSGDSAAVRHKIRAGRWRNDFQAIFETIGREFSLFYPRLP
jgi:hypothetical protein